MTPSNPLFLRVFEGGEAIQKMTLRLDCFGDKLLAMTGCGNGEGE
jgi:hypothetical protein